MLDQLLSYDPSMLSPEIREQMKEILTARGEILRASAEVSDLRARAWAGETSVGDLAELKAAELAKLRQDYASVVIPLLKEAVDLDKLQGLIPMLFMAVISSFNVPLPVVMEAVGIDLDNFKMLTDQIKTLISDN